MRPGLASRLRLRRPRAARSSIAALAAAGLLLGGSGAGGCGGGAGALPPPLPGDVTVALGGAADDGTGFVPLAGDLTLISGAQGGFHVWMKYRVTGAAAGMYHVTYTARRVVDGVLVLIGERRPELAVPADGGAWESPTAIPAFMCPSPIGVQVRDQVMRLQLLFMDMADATQLAAAQAEFTPHCPDGDQAVFCASICSG